MELYQPTDEQQALWDEWVEDRPEHVAWVARDFNPWTLYEFKETGQKVTLESFEEQQDGSVTLRVHVSPSHNPHCFFPRDVFGVSPDLLRAASEDE